LYTNGGPSHAAHRNAFDAASSAAGSAPRFKKHLARTRHASAALSGDAAAAIGWSGILAAFAIVYAVLGVTVVPAAIE
jgi:hypothetical protein